ncbi:GvpL/GvpF family gas vesicle protein [Streptomyces sp. NPDC014724]|uniref:GvpL/GvpF family gas vesicle protein n=1 Tax=unclassified Streptomyces TaxID=2593676 RepID=UPI0036F61257
MPAAGAEECRRRGQPGCPSADDPARAGCRRRRPLEEARRRPRCEASFRLGEAVAAGLESRAAEAGRRVLRELTPMSRVVATGPDIQECVLSVSFPVNRGDSDNFRSVAERIADAHRERVELRLAGPLPCYGFGAAEGTHVRAAEV